MLFWLLCALLTVAVTIVTLRPVMSRTPESTTLNDNPDLQVYKQQLAEVDRDIARGILSENEAEAARVEISRRILAAAPDSNAPVDDDRTADPFYSGMVFYLVAAVIATSSLGLYLMQGSPGYQGQPFAKRASKPVRGAPVNELIARVEARLREAPDDGRGWDVVAPFYLNQQRHQDAIRAYSRAIELLGENRARLRGLAEAHLAASNGIVGDQVRRAYRKILAKEPELIAPRFWLAVGLEQDGDRAAAKAAYEALLKTTSGPTRVQLPPALRQLISERLAAVSGSKSPAKRLPETGKGPALPPGAAAGLAPKEQSAMIEQMVSGLAERLNANGGTEQEWQRLMRAYTVLGRPKPAMAALAKAKQQYASDPVVTNKLDAFARSLGLNPG